MKKILPLLFATILSAQSGRAQQYTITGYVSDRESGEKLISATVFDSRSGLGAVSNTYGFYSLTLPAGNVNLQVSYLGYLADTVAFRLDRDTLINFKLQPGSVLKEVTVVAEERQKIQKQTQMSQVSVPVKAIAKVPALLGEVDVLKVIQLLPGVQAGTEGQSGIYVRGGSPDQNLILLDGVPVYNISHIAGFFSVFNSDAINNVTLTKGGFPARYGGRLASVLEINMKEGNNKEFHGRGSIGLISSRVTVEGPIQKDKTSFMISGRRTYWDILTRPFIKKAQEPSSNYSSVPTFYFYDFNAKVNHKFNDRHRLFLSLYTGRDIFGLKETYKYQNSSGSFDGHIGWGNITTALRWNYLISQKLFANTSLTYSRFRFDTGFKDTYENNTEGFYEASGRYFSGINDVASRIDFDYVPNPRHYIRFGIGDTYHTYNPGIFTYKENDDGNKFSQNFGDNKQFSHEMAAYIEDDMRLGALKANIGVHLSAFKVKKTFFVYPQPRIGLRYLLNDRWSLKASFATMAQYINLLSTEGLRLPTDLWVPSTERVRPQTSWQVAAGAATTWDQGIEFSVEAYYKKMNNVISYKEGATFFNDAEGILGTTWENKISQGTGTAYGIELFAQKKFGKTSGWIGYTLAWNKRQFDDINNGEEFPYRYDRRHDFKIVVSHDLSKRIRLSATWVYNTGLAISLPIARYRGEFPGNPYRQEFTILGKKNSFRMPAYHRLDLGAEFIKQKKWGERAWVISVYNAYNRPNPFYIYRGYNWRTEKEEFRQVSLFPIVPSVAYRFKF